jgi:hypothetical protein
MRGLQNDFRAKVETLAESAADTTQLLNTISRGLERLLETEQKRVL